jgi:hypothetical protein
MGLYYDKIRSKVCNQTRNQIEVTPESQYYDTTNGRMNTCPISLQKSSNFMKINILYTACIH